MATEQALRTARVWASDPEDTGNLSELAREFLKLHEQVARLERERDVAQRIERTTHTYAEGLMNLILDLAKHGRVVRTEGMENTHLLAKAREVESRLADAERRVAREAFVAGALWADREVPADTLNTPMAEAEARRRYPAPPRASEGERETPCHRGGNCLAPSVCATGGPCQYRPTPQAAPPAMPWRIAVQEMGSPEGASYRFVDITPADARRIVALAQTTEG